MSWIVKERMGLPVWDGEFVRGIKEFGHGQTITKADFEEARQDEDEQAMLVEHNCYTQTELDDIAAREEEARLADEDTARRNPAPEEAS